MDVDMIKYLLGLVWIEYEGLLGEGDEWMYGGVEEKELEKEFRRCVMDKLVEMYIKEKGGDMSYKEAKDKLMLDY